MNIRYSAQTLFLITLIITAGCISLPQSSQNEKIPSNLSILSDKGGNQSSTEKAQNGSEFVEYQYPNPVTGVTEPKLAFVQRIDDAWLPGSGIYGPNISITSQAPDTIRDILHAKVSHAIRFAREAGKEDALLAFNNASGPFAANGSYIFAFDKDGITLAMPFHKEKIGKNEANLKDLNEVDIGPEKLRIAGQGGGYFYYVYNNPDDAGKPELKVSYVEPVDSSWVLGSGVYLPKIPVTFKKEKRENLRSHVSNAVSYVKKYGPKKAVDEFNDPNGTFSRPDMFIFAFDRNATLLANPYLPGIVGLNRSMDRDPYGEYPVQRIIENAKKGGGFVYYFFPDPATNYSVRLKLGYSQLAADDLIVGAGIFSDLTE